MNLTGQLVHRLPSSEGKMGLIILVEENGDQYKLVCLCRLDGTTTISEEGDGRNLAYLNDRYTSQVVCLVARDAVLKNEKGQH